MKEMSNVITDLKCVQWFSSVGLRVAFDSEMDVSTVGAWKDAIVLRGEVGSSNAFLDGVNLLTRTLSSNYRKEDRMWNNYAATCRESLDACVFPAVDSIIEENSEIFAIEGGIDSLKENLRWDLSHIVMEHVYSDLVAPRFYTLLLEFYKAGHFPCKWDSVWPDGKLCVY